jgi:hypothetical protein
LKETHAAPVERTDDGDNERDAIQDHHSKTYPFR